METEKRFIDTIGITGHEACELPAQEDPGIDQKQLNPEQEETQGRVARGGGRTRTAQDTIAALDPETTPILLVDSLNSPVETDEDKGQPFASSSSGVIRDERGFESQGDLRAIAEDVCRDVLAAPWQRARIPAFLPRIGQAMIAP